MSNSVQPNLKATFAAIMADTATLEKRAVKEGRLVREPLKPFSSVRVPMKTVTDFVKMHIPALTFQPSLVHPGGGKLVTVVYPSLCVGVTKLVWSSLCEKFKSRPDELARIQDLIDATVSTNGTIMSVLTRMSKTLPALAFDIQYTQELADYVDRWLPMRLQDEPGDPDFTHPMFTINRSAEAGMPFKARGGLQLCGNKEISLEAHALAQQYICLLKQPDALSVKSNGAFIKYMTAHPLEFTYVLKRKFERVKRCEADVKARPYFVAPYALKLLFKWVGHYAIQQSIGFWETIDGQVVSASAYRFSWSSGGAERILQWARSFAEKAQVQNKLVFGAISFGDDQLWVFCFPDGSMVFVAPDVFAMDANIPGAIPRREMGRHIAGFKSRPSDLYHHVCMILSEHSTRFRVIVHGALVVVKQLGENSGVVMTTQMDIHMSVITQYHVNRMVACFNEAKSANFDTMLAAIPKVVKAKTGCVFKPETMVPYHTHIDKLRVLPLSFLGYVVVFDERLGKSYPVPKDLDKCWASAAIPSAPLNDEKTIAVLMSRLYGLLLSGYCFNPDFNSFARNLFDFCKKQGVMPTTVTDVSELVCGFDIKMTELIGEYPFPLTPHQTILFYTLGPKAVGDKQYAKFVTDLDQNTEEIDASIVASPIAPEFAQELTVDILYPKAIPPSKVGRLIGRPRRPPLRRGVAGTPGSSAAFKEKGSRVGAGAPSRGEDHGEFSDADVPDEVGVRERTVQQEVEADEEKFSQMLQALSDRELERREEEGEDLYQSGEEDEDPYYMGEFSAAGETEMSRAGGQSEVAGLKIMKLSTKEKTN